MKALIYNSINRRFSCKNTEIPRIKSDELLIKIKSSALCGTDLHIMDGPLSSKRYANEIILGHSFSGEISICGKKTKGFKKGDRVFVSDFVWCGKCKNCLNNRQNLCDNRYVFGMEVTGSHAEYIKVPAKSCFLLPAKINFDQGSLICDVLALVYHAIKKATLQKGDRVLIIGAGPIGLCLGFLLKSYGFANFKISEKISERISLGKKILKKDVFRPNKFKSSPNSFEAVFDTSGDKLALDLGFKTLTRGGKLIMIGVQDKPYLLNSIKWISRELSLLGIFDFSLDDVKESLRLVESKKIDLKKIITHHFSLEDGAKAYKLLKNRTSGKIILHP